MNRLISSYKMVLAGVLFNVVISSSAFAVRESGGRRSQGSAVQLDFTSFGTGIDTNALESILDLTRDAIRNGDANAVYNATWGREGERTICIEFDTQKAANAFQEEAWAIVATFENGEAYNWTTVNMRLKCKKAPPTRLINANK